MPETVDSSPWLTGAPQRILLLGATGTIGLATGQALIQRGYEVVCFVRPHQDVRSRSREKKLKATLMGASFRYGDPLNALSMALPMSILMR